MLIPGDIQYKAHWWGLDPALIAAVDIAEGGGEHLTTAVRCSVETVRDRDHAIEICCRSCAHAMTDFLKGNQQLASMQMFIIFWSRRWAPERAENDPNNLNPNWATNVTKIYNQLQFHPTGAIGRA